MKNKLNIFLIISSVLLFLAIPVFAQEIPETIDLPIAGEIQTKNFSLPLLTIIIGGIDGFNPCAMWVLLFLITLLINMKNKKRMWFLGTLFIVASAVVYFLFMSAWLNFFIFLGFLKWIRWAVALFALGAGIYHVRKFIINKNATCKVTGSEKRRKTFDKIKNIVNRKNLLLASSGIIILAGAVNLVELLCSTGLPAIYTSVLAMAEIPVWHYYMYLLLYILIFMIDDLVIFFIAMSTLKTIGISTKYSRYTGLIGGIIMIIIGVLLVLKPGWLMFG